jgi:hypothetical protein
VIGGGAEPCRFPPIDSNLIVWQIPLSLIKIKRRLTASLYNKLGKPGEAGSGRVHSELRKEDGIGTGNHFSRT